MRPSSTFVTAALLAASATTPTHAFRAQSTPVRGRAFGGGGVSSRHRASRATIQMPSLFVQAAYSPASGPRGLCLRLSKTLAETLGKPESYVLTSFSKVDAMAFGGDADLPCAFLYCSSIGAITPETNAKASAAIAEILQEELGVNSDRYYINFFDTPRPNTGFKGGTF